jgi:hypothetical protein
MRAAAIVLGLVGCGTQSANSFLLETTDCALVNTFKAGGAATPWTDGRIYWTGAPNNILTVELTTPGVSGSFVSPGAGWIRASVSVPVGGVDSALAITPFPSTLPTTLTTDQIALDMMVTGCPANLGAEQGVINTMADVGDLSASFSMSFNLSCGATMLTGGFILTASGSAASADPATVVTPAT